MIAEGGGILHTPCYGHVNIVLNNLARAWSHHLSSHAQPDQIQPQ